MSHYFVQRELVKVSFNDFLISFPVHYDVQCSSTDYNDVNVSEICSLNIDIYMLGLSFWICRIDSAPAKHLKNMIHRTDLDRNFQSTLAQKYIALYLAYLEELANHMLFWG